MLTALVVEQFGITFLPWMYLANAVLIMAGSLLYSQILYAFENRTLIMVSIVTAMVMLVLDASVFSHYLPAFLAVTLVVLGVFVSQLHIMLLAFIEELFTPNENERANPLIETSEPIGGIIGGIILAAFAGHIHVTDFTYFWAFFVLIIIPVLLFFYKKRHKFVTLIHQEALEEKHDSGHNRFRQGVTHLRAIPFVRFLAIVIFCQWMFVNILNYQYTKVVDESVTQDTKSPIVQVENSPTQSEHAAAPKAAEEAHEETAAALETKVSEHSENEVHTEEAVHEASAEGHAHEDLLTHGLGTLHIVFSLLMLLMQLLFSSRLVARFGIVNAMKVLPGVSLASMMTMLFSFQFFTVVAAKGLYETLLVVHTNAYHNAYYAISERIREQIREFLEGVMRPAGIFVGTALLLVGQWLVPSEHLDTTLTLTMTGVLLLMLILLSSMRSKYTLLAKKNLDLIGDHPEKHVAIEILSQSGHNDASEILTKNLIYKNESPRTKMQILKSLGHIHDVDALPEILGCLSDKDEGVQIAACRALAAYKHLGRHFFSQAFAKYRVVNALAELFTHTQSKTLRSEIVQVFANLHHDDVVPFLVEMLEKGDDSIKADIISIIRMFRDINAGYFIEKYLEHPDPMVKAQTIIALWQFKKYRLKLMIHLTSLLDDEADLEKLHAGIYVLGETRSIQEIPRLMQYLQGANAETKTVAAVALAKLGKIEALEHLLEAMLDTHNGAGIKHMVRNVDRYYLKMLNAHLERHIQTRIGQEFGGGRHLILDALSLEKLRDLRYYYELMENDQEILKIERMIHVKELASKK